MGAELVGIATIRYAHLQGRQYKALIRMCWRVLDDKPGRKATKLWPDGQPAQFWYAKWEELALAMGRSIPADPKARENLRREVNKVCRQLVKAGAIEAREHPFNKTENAYYVALGTPDPGVILYPGHVAEVPR